MLFYLSKEKNCIMTKICIVYVTRDGHSRALAEEVGKKTGAEVFEIVDGTNRKGFFGYMKTGRQSMMRVATPIVDPGIDLSKYDHITIVEPTWAGSVPPSVRTWISSHKSELSGKKFSLLLTNKGSAGEPVRKKFEDEFGGVVGKLAAFAVVRENLAEEDKSRIVSDFIQQMAQE